MNGVTVEHKHVTRSFVEEVLFDGNVYTARLVNRISGKTQICSGWRSYRAALETVQDMYDDEIRRRGF